MSEFLGQQIFAHGEGGSYACNLGVMSAYHVHGPCHMYDPSLVAEKWSQLEVDFYGDLNPEILMRLLDVINSFLIIAVRGKEVFFLFAGARSKGVA